MKEVIKMSKNKWIPNELKYRFKRKIEEATYPFVVLLISSDLSHSWFKQFYKEKKPWWKRTKWIDVPDSVSKEISQVKVVSWKEERRKENNLPPFYGRMTQGIGGDEAVNNTEPAGFLEVKERMDSK